MYIYTGDKKDSEETMALLYQIESDYEDSTDNEINDSDTDFNATHDTS